MYKAPNTFRTSRTQAEKIGVDPSKMSEPKVQPDPQKGYDDKAMGKTHPTGSVCNTPSPFKTKG